LYYLSPLTSTLTVNVPLGVKTLTGVLFAELSDPSMLK